MRRILIVALLLMVAVLTMAATNCSDEQGEDTRRGAVEERLQAFDRAQRLYPEPNTSNFPLRQALVEFTERQDLINHPWYVYILGFNGNVIGYYVAKTVPVNACNFLSSTEIVREDEWGNSVLTAPSLDGIYYGGSGASSGCDAWFFFDNSTNALIQIRGVFWFAADQPLSLEAEAISVRED